MRDKCVSKLDMILSLSDSVKHAITFHVFCKINASGYTSNVDYLNLLLVIKCRVF